MHLCKVGGAKDECAALTQREWRALPARLERVSWAKMGECCVLLLLRGVLCYRAAAANKLACGYTGACWTAAQIGCAGTSVVAQTKFTNNLMSAP